MQREIRKRMATHAVAAVLLAAFVMTAAFTFGFQLLVSPAIQQLYTFSSYDELENFLKTNMEHANIFRGLYWPVLSPGLEDLQTMEASSANEYSTTNIQVAGVDEADIVKTDGEFLYVVSGPNITIVKVYPPNQAEVLSTIELNETYDVKIYVQEDRLAVLANKYQVFPFALAEGEEAGERLYAPYSYPEVFVRIYDISDKANPVPTRTVILNGTLSGSRMIEKYVYVIVNQPSVRQYNETDFEVTLPKISGSYEKEVQPNEIHYVDVPDVVYYFTTVVAINVIDDAQEPTYETFLTGSTSCIYVSRNNMYLVVPNTNMWILSARGESGTRDKTFVYRVKLDGKTIVAAAQGAVYGYVLNQFSMDEYNGFFRIATTKWTDTGSENNLFTLDMSLNIVGELTGLAPGERIYSARFMGDRCYLVTFRQVDPFFVIDLSSPTEPEVLGALKIPGFSGYLHPYDENHIIGIGKQENNVKLSLFNVTDVTTPTETAKYIIQAEWSDSPVLWDHKAFLFDKSRQLLALPVSTYLSEMIDSTNNYWRGAYIFNITSSDGIVLRGKITHVQSEVEEWDSSYGVKRILYIENTLYTVSDKKIKMNDLTDLTPIGEINLP